MPNRKVDTMNLKSFFDLENVVFSREDLETPYEDKPTDIIFIKENLPYKKNSTKQTLERRKKS